MGVWKRIMAGVRAFRETYMSAGTLEEGSFGDFTVRKLRYEIYFAFFENTVYRSTIHSWATSYRLQQSLYKHIRPIYNPAYRLGDFWRIHLMGGLIDPAAGDGIIKPSALPIIIPNENHQESQLREALGQLWEWSNLQSRKDVFTLYGTIMGDVGLKVVDDIEKKKVYLEIVHPGTIKSIDLDAFGNVKGYELEETRLHPETDREIWVTYGETADRDGKNVVYKTFLDGKPYAWNGEAVEWSEPYGFVPFVTIKHNDIGLDWGWGEFHPARSKFHEVDDIASALSDQIRKSVNVVWFFTGHSKPKETPTMVGAEESTSRPEPLREEVNALYSSNAQANAKALVAPLDIEATLNHMNGLLARLEEDYPELKFEELRISNVSGETLREARKPVEEKVVQRRVNYDAGLVRAQKMALSIGGFRKIFDGFDLTSFERGHLDHHIGKRPVFTSDPISDLERDKLFWLTAEQAGKAGVTLSAFLRLQGWTDDQIDRVILDEEYLENKEAKTSALYNLGAIEQPTLEQSDEEWEEEEEEL